MIDFYVSTTEVEKLFSTNVEFHKSYESEKRRIIIDDDSRTEVFTFNLGSYCNVIIKKIGWIMDNYEKE